jgi:arsenate reductase
LLNQNGYDKLAGNQPANFCFQEKSMATRVLFLCTGNSARSQMAEAFLRKYGGDKFEAFSAGLEPKGLNPFTVKVMQEIGFDMSGHRSKGVGEYLGKVLFQYLITVCDDAEKNCPTVWPGVNTRMHWSFEDPAAFQGTEAEKLEKFRQVRDLIEEKIKSWLTEQGLATQ